ncbi:MAG: DUF1207 domain-containing protein [Elusimicrobia bacterium]|jgi:hypothetical protein|nr:DUF1207 domain-containing protein [Elusimicrobiota bacterium]
MLSTKNWLSFISPDHLRRQRGEGFLVLARRDRSLPTQGNRNFLFGALLMLIIALGQPIQADIVADVEPPKVAGGLRFFPSNDVFRPLLADPKERQFFMSMLSVKTPTDSYTAWSVGFGESLGLVRWDGQSFQSQLSFLAGVFSQFDWSTPSKDLLNTDFTFGVAATHRWSRLTGRLQYYHQSSHLGDELLLHNPIPRLNYSYEALENVLALETPLYRIYGSAEYLVSRDPTYLKRWNIHSGAELRGGASPAFFRPVAGLDLMWKKQHPDGFDVSAKAGLEMGKPAMRDRHLRLLLEFYDGYSPYGQFFDLKIRYLGVGVYVGF